MGDAYDENADDRGYVEPEPLVWLRFKNLSDLTAQGLKNYGMLSQEEEENLSRLSEMADRLLEITKKELRDEVLTDDEYEFIRSYGGNIEHFASGSVYTFYQFRWPMENRLTDSEWHQMMGIKQKEDGTWESDPPTGHPEWTKSYRVIYGN